MRGLLSSASSGHASWDFDPWVGGQMRLILGGENDTNRVEDEGTVTAYDPPRVLEFTIPYYSGVLRCIRTWPEAG